MEELRQEPYFTEVERLVDLESFVGKEVGLSPWYTITQEMIDQFAQTTQDEQWIHVDVEKSKQFSPYGTTVAHGFLVLSYASRFTYDCYRLNDVVFGVNYGLNKVRFPNATVSGAKIRGRISLLEYKAITKGARYVLKVVVEIEGQEKPACVAEFVAQAYHA